MDVGHLMAEGSHPVPAGRDMGRADHWRLDYLFSISIGSWVVHLCVSLLAGLVLIGAGAGNWAVVWTVAMVVLSAAMATLALAYRRRHIGVSTPAYGVIHSGLTGIAGLTWGLGAVMCALSSSVEILTFYTLALGGTALGAVSSQHMLMRSCLISVWTSVPLLALAWLAHDLAHGPVASAGMVMLFGLILTVLAQRMSGFLEQNVLLANALAARNAVLQRTSAELAEAQEEKSRFLAQASHDLRQPIHAIGLYVEYLHGLSIGREGREVLGNIDLALASLARLCRSLLDLAALDVGRVTPEIGPVALGEVMGEVARQAQAAAQARGITIRFRPSRLWVRSDAALLHTMVQNLVSNAIKYAPGSDILLGVRRRGGTLSIVVMDTGPGIAKDDRERIFKEFVQIRAPSAPELDGLGLGLSIVRRLADMLGQRIEVVSRPGRGASFFIDGLVETAPAPTRSRAVPASHVNLLKGLKVLVVDDDRAVRDSTVQLLGRWGCSVHATDRITPAIEQGSFDFLLVDQELAGDEDGLSLIRRLRQATGRRVAAAIITGGRTDHLTARCRQEGTIILVKPVRPAQLRSALLTSVESRSSHGQTTPNSAASPAAAALVDTPSARSTAET